MHVPRNILEDRTHPAIVNWTPTNSCEPTTALPGTPEKIVVMSDRLRRGQPLWHPDDHSPLGDTKGSGVPTVLSVVATSFVANASFADG